MFIALIVDEAESSSTPVSDICYLIRMPLSETLGLILHAIRYELCSLLNVKPDLTTSTNIH